MEKGKSNSQEDTCTVKEVDGKYFCTACKAEVKAEYGHEAYCPECNKRVDWIKIYAETHRLYP
ncbi:MAG: hypothetical protein WC370_10700 [Dehalococcoidales bacterium]|jgi:Zn finger protein HypA/HybF involved in hydrogenase expression